MATTADTIGHLKREWASPREASHGDAPCPFPLHCQFGPGATSEEIAALDVAVPPELQDFWRESESAELFKDGQYGQWGLQIFSPNQASEATRQYQQERQRDAVEGDLVVGTFFGDSDLLIIRCDKTSGDFGNVLIALPLDPRSDWDFVGNDFKQFLDAYVAAQGGKFWENR